ncbi:hypothetical protein C0J52_08599 [Blattella germanica]|nr:hypothetical protein C0J52_08599 [Blattella germanica]
MVSFSEKHGKKNAAPLDSTVGEGRKLAQYVAGTIVSLLAFNNGLTVCWSPTMIPVLLSENTPLEEGPISMEVASWLASIQCLGALLAGPLYIVLINRYSRKVAGYLLATPFIVSWILIIISSTLNVLYIARFIGRIGNGAAVAFPPIYTSQMAEDSVRGAR